MTNKIPKGMREEMRFIPRIGRTIRVLTNDEKVPVGPKKLEQRSAPFVRMPMTWVDKLGEINASGTTWRIAAEILWRAFSRRSLVITLPQIDGVSRRGRRAALVNLERAGMIKVDRRDDKSPIVTVVTGS